MSDDRITTWVELQRKVWNCDDDLRAQLICLENGNGDTISQWPVDLENLPEVIKTTIDMQSSEMPKGSHRLRLVAYADKSRKTQLNELPQTIRGRSQDATAAYADAIALQRATAMAVTNLENTLAIMQRYAEKSEEGRMEMTENFRLAFDKLTESNAENFDQKLRFAEFEAKQRRADQMMESLLTCITPVLTIAVEKFGPKLFNMDPAKLQDMLTSTKPQPPPAPPTAPALQGANNGEQQPTAIEPDNAPSARVPQPGQGSVSSDAKGRAEGNGERATRKRSAAPKRTTTTTKARKQRR